MKKIGVYILLGFCFLQMSACGDDDEQTSTPDLSIIQGSYDTEIQHDVISSASGLEVTDTSYLEDFSNTSVIFNANEVSFSFPKGGRYELPDLTYEVRDVVKWEIFDYYSVYLTLKTTSDYRMKASPNMVVQPAFIIYDDNPQNPYKVDLTLFLRSQDPDSVYNIWVVGNK